MYRELVPLVVWLFGRLGVGRVDTVIGDGISEFNQSHWKGELHLHQATPHELDVVQLLNCSRSTLIVLELNKSMQQTFATRSTKNLNAGNLANSAHVLHEVDFIGEVGQVSYENGAIHTE